MWQKTKNIYHLAVAILSNTYFLFPGRKLTIIGITGTDGKTTTSSLTYHILKTAGKKVSLISTVAAYIGDTTYDTGFHVTNPAPFSLQRFLRKITLLGMGKEENYLVLEVTSHGIDQNRIWGIPFAIAGLTNITHEHLDYHKTYENYVTTKVRLLQRARIAIFNKDDSSYNMVNAKLTSKTKKKIRQKTITYGFGKNADINPQTVPFKTNLPGKYNIYNCILAIAICKQVGISGEDIKKGIATFSPPTGRTQVIYDKDFTVMVDFAHTPNAIEQVLQAVRPAVKGRLIHVFGSAGLRDNTKRPLMGKAAAIYDDIIVLTAEDPRTEKIAEINAQIKSKIFNFQFAVFNQNKNFQFTKGIKYLFDIPNRQDAVNAAIAMARKGDFIILTGKGHEASINYGNGEEPWSDFKAVAIALKNKKKAKHE